MQNINLEITTPTKEELNKNILSKSNNQVQTHVELVIKQLNEPTKDFLNKIYEQNSFKDFIKQKR